MQHQNNQVSTPQLNPENVQSPASGANTNSSSLSPGASASANETQQSALSPSASSQTSQSADLTPGPGGVLNSSCASSNNQCCENGRPVMTDPVSGQTVCSCQYDSARLALSGYTRIPTAGVYGSPYPSTDQNPYPSIGVDSSAFYSPLVSRILN